MAKLFVRSLFAALSLLVVVASTVHGAEGTEEKVALEKVPEPVLEAFKAKFPEAKLEAASKKEKEGKVSYNLTSTDKDRKYEVRLKRDGTFIAIVKFLESKELPKAVADALSAKYPKAKYDVIEEITKKDKIELYEIALTTAQGKMIEMLVDPSGKVAEKKEEKRDEQKDEKKKEKKAEGAQEKIALDKVPMPVLDALKEKKEEKRK